MKSEIHLRFYEELNGFLPPGKRKRRFSHFFEGAFTVGDLLRDFKIPPDQVEMVLANGDSVEFSQCLGNGDTVSVYPAFESLDVGPVIRLREKPLRRTCFLAEPALGRLARRLRMLGFDTRILNEAFREDVIRRAEKDRRILLTREAELLRDPALTRVHLVRQEKARDQLREIMLRFDLCGSAVPGGRCPYCNRDLRGRRDRICPECGKKVGGGCSLRGYSALFE